MRLVWVIIPLVLIGMIGVQESYASHDPDNKASFPLYQSWHLLALVVGTVVAVLLHRKKKAWWNYK